MWGGNSRKEERKQNQQDKPKPRRHCNAYSCRRRNIHTGQSTCTHAWKGNRRQLNVFIHHKSSWFLRMMARALSMCPAKYMSWPYLAPSCSSSYHSTIVPAAMANATTPPRLCSNIWMATTVFLLFRRRRVVLALNRIGEVPYPLAWATQVPDQV